MVAILLAALIQSAVPRVTVIARGATIGSVLKEVSKQTGVAVDAAEQIRDEVVIVSVKDASLPEFEQHIAEVLGAQWSKGGGVMRLVRPASLERAQAATERRLRIAEVTAGVEKLRKRVAAQAEFNETSARDVAQALDLINTKYKGHLSDSPGLEATIELEPKTPSGRLAIAAVASLSPEQVADVDPGERIVYSTDPTQMQRRLPGRIGAAIERYRSEQRLYTQALSRLPVGQGSGRFAVSDADPSKQDEVAAVIIVTARSPYNPNLTVDVHLVRKDGVFIGGARSLLDLGESSPTEKPIAQGKAPLSDDSIRFVAASIQLQKGKTFLDDQYLLDQLTHPEKHDPLSYVVSDGVFTLGKEQNVIASVPDIGFIETAFTAIANPKELDLGRFSNWLTNNCEVKQTNGWFSASPKRKVQTRSLRVDRGTLGQFFRRCIENSGIQIDDLAQFVSMMPRNYMDTIAPMLAFFVLPDLNAAVNDRTVEILRVYGRMIPDQRALLATGKPIAVENLVEASWADLNHLVFRADPPLSYISKTPPGKSGGFVQSVHTEVTNELPNGVPAKATILAFDNSSDAVIADGGTGGGNYHPMTAWSLAYTLVRAERADPTDKRERVQIEKYRYGHTRRLNFEISLSEGLGVHEAVTETSFPRKDASVPYDQLPESFRKAVETAMVQVRKQEDQRNNIPPPLR